MFIQVMTPWPPPSHKNVSLIHHLIPSISRHTIIPVLHGIAISWAKVTYRTWEIFGEGKFRQTIEVKAIGEENFGE